MSRSIVVAVPGRVMLIRINRPEKKNALTQEMYTRLTRALNRADADSGVRVIILGDDCFTAGNDLTDFPEKSLRFEDTPMFQFVTTLAFVNKPIVAAVNGAAIGIGTTMLLHCDLVCAGKNSQFQLPFVNLGLIPEAGSTLLLPQMSGHPKAAELLLLGDMFDAEKALQTGIINRICRHTDTLQVATDMANRLAAQPSNAMCLTKSLMKKHRKQELLERIHEEAGHFAACLESPKVKQAMQTFLATRQVDLPEKN